MQAGGNTGLVVNFTQQLREKPELRLMRMENNRIGGVDIWLGLRQPIPLRTLLGEVEGVADVSRPAGRDLSFEGSDPPLTVQLKAAQS